MSTKLAINERFKKNDANVIDKTKPAADAFIADAETVRENEYKAEPKNDKDFSISKKKATMKITIAPELKMKLNDIAEKEYTSASGLITKALINYIKENY